METFEGTETKKKTFMQKNTSMETLEGTETSITDKCTGTKICIF